MTVYTGGFQGAVKQIQIQLRGGTPDGLNTAGAMIAAELKKVPGAVDVGLSTKG